MSCGILKENQCFVRNPSNTNASFWETPDGPAAGVLLHEDLGRSNSSFQTNRIKTLGTMWPTGGLRYHLTRNCVGEYSLLLLS